VTAPTVLLFDLGGVLVENVGFERFNALLPTPKLEEELKTLWLRSPAVRAFETGLCSPEAFADAVVAEYGLKISPSAFLEALVGWPRGLYPGAEELLTQLRTRYRVACLSNSNALHWQRFGGFVDHFHISLSSHLLGVIKPDAACFAAALRDCDVDPASAAFFDDSAINVDAARDFGLQAFHVNGLSDVKRVLLAEGWLETSALGR
jgi:glucose-1-phosphatase